MKTSEKKIGVGIKQIDSPQRTEKMLSEKYERKMSTQDVKRLMHELEIHQTELEMQNEELRKAQKEIEKSRSKYSDLYDFAPVAYFTFDQMGKVMDVNLTGARLLGVERRFLMNRNFAVFVAPEFRKDFGSYCSAVWKKGSGGTFELELMKKDGTTFYALMESIVVENRETNLALLRSSVIDNTERRNNSEKILRQSALLDGINKVLIEALTCQTDEEVADKCLNVAQVLTKSKFGFMGEINQSGRFDTTAISDPGWEACRIPRSDSVLLINNMEMRGIWANVLKDERSLIVNDPAAYPNRVGTPEGHPPLTCFLGVPLKHMRKTIGMIAMANKETGYDSIDQQDIEALGMAFVEALMRKRAEEALRTASLYTRSLIEASLDPFVTISADGKIMDVNKATEIVTGVPREQLIGSDFSDFFTEPWKAREGYEEVFSKGTVTDYPLAIRHASGRATDVLYNATVFRNESGEVKGIFAAARDISRVKKSEDALRAASFYARSLIEASLDPLVTIGRDGKVTDVNTATEKVTGYSRRQLIGTDFIDYFSEPEKAKSGYQQVFRDGFIQDYALEIRHKSGHLTPVLYNASVFQDEAGQVIGVFAAARDITERKKAEEALKESEERYRSLFENSIDAVLLTSPDGRILKANAEACRIFGSTEEELCKIGRDGIVDVSDPRLPGALEERIRTGKFKAELTFLRRDGTKFPAEISSALFKDKDGLIRTSMTIRDITERRRAEEILRESESRYRDLIETARDVIFTLSLQGVFTSFNPAFETVTGWSAKEWIGKVFVDLLDPDDVPKAIERFKTVMEGQLGEPIELRIRTKYGGVVHGEFVASPQMKEGEVIGILGIARDITKRKEAEEALRNSEEKYRTILENIEDGYFEVDIAGNLTFFNASFCRIYGYPREELMGMNDRQYTDQENAKKLFQTFNRVYRTGESAKGTDWKIIRKDGMKRNIEASVSLIKDPSGKGIGFRGLVRDITERKQAEEQLSKLFRAVEQSPATVMITDTDANIQYVNPKFTQLTGYTLEEVIGKNPRILKSGETPPEEYKLLWETIVSGREWRGEFHDKKKNGDLYWESASISSIKNPEGLITHYVAVKEDITERKRTEEEKATLQEELRQSQKMEAIGRLAGGVAHDFNNLLTVIKGYCQLSLAEIKESTPIRDSLEVINKAAEKAADLTRQLLAFSRRQIMEVKVLDLNTLLQNLDKMLRRIIGEDIELVTALGEDLGRVKADPGQIEQVIMNLAVNAKDAMPKGGKLIIETANVELDNSYARAHVAVTPGRYVMIAVSDTGTGMAPEVRDRVFEPFFTTKGKGKGTGLGLSTVYGIVKQSGGNIWVYSEPDRGTTLKIYLPRVDEPAEKLKAQVLGEEFPRGSETILIVEDDKEVRNLAVRILTRQGYTVLDGSYGAETFNVCRQHKGPIHLLLTDVVMPGMDGRALSESLSQLHPEMKVLYMSGYTEDTVIHHGVMEKGMNYIQKPFTVSGLTNKVREVLNKVL